MLKRTTLAKSLLIAFSGTALCTAALAQQTDGSTQELQRVEVTGSNIKRADAETPSPVQVITADDLKKSGYTTVSQVLSNITANGQGTLSQGFAGAFASGASGIALRGLTVGATLVLIDGHRMAPYPIGDDGQRSFVDISNIPFDAVERIEVLKDGASAVYGSDAIAGVVNVILKRSFVGKTITVDGGTSYKGDGTTGHIAGTVGFGDLDTDGRNFYLSAEYRHEGQITFADRGGSYTRRDYSSNGGDNLTRGLPTQLNNGHPGSTTGYITDPNTGDITGFFPGCDQAKLTAGGCTYQNTWSQIQPETSNLNLVAHYTQNLNPNWQLSLQGTYFESKSQQVGGPSATFTGGYQGITSGPGVIPTFVPPGAGLGPTTIPSSNPSFPTGTGATSGVLHYNFLNSLGASPTDTDAKSTRFIADLEGHIAGWDTSASVGYTEVRLSVDTAGLVNPVNLQDALNGQGPDNSYYLVGGNNSAAMNAFIAPELTTTDTSKLSFAHLGATHDLMQLDGGPLSLALGVDYTHRDQNALAPAGVAAGYYSGFASNNYTVGTQTVGSVYGELVAPITKRLEADAAVRYDHYNLSGGRASPKVGFKFQAIPELTFRGTASGGFRAPGPAENGTAGQTFFAASTNDPILCPKPDNQFAVGNFPTQCALSLGTVQSTNPALKPETSKSFTLGLIAEPTKELSATVDLYYIEIDHQIVAGGPGGVVRGTNFSPIDEVVGTDASGNPIQKLTVPSVAPIAYLTTGYVNANKTTTDGIDVDITWKHRFEGVGDFKSDFQITYMDSYKITYADGTTYQLAGTHGPFVVSGDTGNPKTHIQWSNTLTRGPLQVTGTINYIGPYSVLDPAGAEEVGVPMDTCANALLYGGGVASTYYSDQLSGGTVPSNVGCSVRAFTTFDLSGKYEVNKQLSLSASILNLFNQGAPLDYATYGGSGAPYNPSLHSQGAIGRYFTIGATYSF